MKICYIYNIKKNIDTINRGINEYISNNHIKKKKEVTKNMNNSTANSPITIYIYIYI